MIDIYFFDSNKRYIGHRKLTDGEKIPINATSEIANVMDKQEAHLVNEKWVVNTIVEEPLPQQK